MTTVCTLGEFSSAEHRCCGCHVLLPLTTPAEMYHTNVSRWVIVRCPKCQCSTPFRFPTSKEVPA